MTLSEAEETITVHVSLPPNTCLPCPEGQTPGGTIKDRRERTWRHLDTCQYRTLVTTPLPRTDCPFCGVKTIAPSWAQAHSRFILLFENLSSFALLVMTTAGAECISNKIHTIKKKTYGFRNIPRFSNAINLHGAGLRLHPESFRKTELLRFHPEGKNTETIRVSKIPLDAIF